MIRAVLGGTFDPVHKGHVAMAAQALARGLADRVLIIPNWQSPHKDRTQADAAERLAMARLAFADVAGAVVDERELCARRPVPTVETLRGLAAEHPDDELRLLLGADHLAAFPRWREPDAVQDLATLVVFGRRGWPLDAAALTRAGIRPDRAIVVTDFDLPVAASDVRAMLAAGQDPTEALPPAVADHIARHGLYRAG